MTPVRTSRCELIHVRLRRAVRNWRPAAMGAALWISLGLVGLAGCTTTKPETEAPRAAATTPRDLLDVHQARKNLLGKPRLVVLQTIGSPDRQAGGGKWEWWTYENRFHDTITHRTIHDVTLVFRGGKLVDITY